jgi:hypothetical protein
MIRLLFLISLYIISVPDTITQSFEAHFHHDQHSPPHFERPSIAQKRISSSLIRTNNIIQIEVFQPSLHISPNHVDISQMRKTFNKVCNSLVLQTQKKEMRLL